MPRHFEHEQSVDFSRMPAPFDRARLFFCVLAYPERDAGVDPNGAGQRFSAALYDYFVWALRQQYGLAKLRTLGIRTRPQAEWARALRQGGARIRRRLQAQRLWAKRGCWISSHEGMSAADLKIFQSQRQSVRATILRDPNGWHDALRLDRRRSHEHQSPDELISQLSSAVRESKSVMHMAWQLDEFSFKQGAADTRPIPAREKLSWRQSFLRSPEWIDEAIRKAEEWRTSQNPLRPNDLSSEQLVELQF